MEGHGESAGPRRLRGMWMLAPLRLRDFRLLWSGMTISLLGDGVFLVALAWQTYQLSNVPTALSIVGLAMSVPHLLLLLLGGVASDRYDRRRVMLAADTVRGLAVAGIGALSLSGMLELPHLVALTALYGAGTAFFGPAFDAIVPELVPEGLLPQANSLDHLVRPLALRLVGPGVGGFVIAATGVGVAFLLDAASFAASALALVAMRSSGARSPDAAGQDPLGPSSVRGQLREGLAYLRGEVWLWGTFLAATLAYLLFTGPVEVLLPFVVKNRLGGSAADLGYIYAAGGLGAIAAALLMGQRGQPRRFLTFTYLSWTLATLAVAGYGLAAARWQAMAASLIFHALETAGTVAWLTAKQRLVPGRLLGRISSLDWFISIALLPLSYALTGPVSALLGAPATLVGAGLLGSAVTLGFLFLPRMRDVERREVAGTEPRRIWGRSPAEVAGPSPSPAAGQQAPPG